MKDLNHITLIGNLTRDPEFKSTPSGNVLCNISIANNQDFKETKYCNFFDCTAWGKLAETINQYLKKGDRVAITGQLRQERWEHEGHNKSRVTITILGIQFLSTKNNQEEKQPENYENPYKDDEKMPF